MNPSAESYVAIDESSSQSFTSTTGSAVGRQSVQNQSGVGKPVAADSEAAEMAAEEMEVAVTVEEVEADSAVAEMEVELGEETAEAARAADGEEGTVAAESEAGKLALSQMDIFVPIALRLLRVH